MVIFNRLKAAFRALTNPVIDLDDPELLRWLNIDPSSSKQAINEATYFICLRMLSETMGKLPLKYYRKEGSGKIRAEPNKAAELLDLRPNHVMTAATFWTMLEYNCNHYGNAYAWIQTAFTKKKYGGEYNIAAFWPMQSSYVQVIMDDAGVFGDKGYLYYRYSDPKTGQSYVFREDNVLHFKTWCTSDGIMGKPVREILRETVEGAAESQAYLTKMYKSGLSVSAVLQYTGELDQKRRKVLQDEYNSILTGSKNAGKVVAIPVGMQLQPIKMSMAEAQFVELKKYNALQIAAAFGIKPNHLNDYEKSSYANSESQQLSFLVDTMLYRLGIYEQELNYKCLTPAERKEGHFFKFNEKVLLRVDAKTQMDTLRMGVNNGLISPNEGRAELDRPSMEGGDILMCNGNYIPVSMVGTKNREGGDNGGKD